jgi:hypothetical protein
MYDTILICFQEQCVIIQMVHVQKWEAAPASDAVLTHDEIAIKNRVARERFSAKKTKHSFAALAELNNPGSLPVSTSTQVKGVEAGGGSDKKIITTIMTQALHHCNRKSTERTNRT